MFLKKANNSVMYDPGHSKCTRRQWSPALHSRASEHTPVELCTQRRRCANVPDAVL